MIRSKLLTRLARTALWFSLAIAVLLASLVWVVPWLGRRGDFNALFESIARSALAIPVAIRNIDTEPFHRFKVTKLETVSAQAEERLHFTAKSVSIFYDPVELFSGHIQSVVLERPQVFLNLNADLNSLARVPEIPRQEKGSSPRGPVPGGGGGQILPFAIDSTLIEGGELTLRIGSRDLRLTGLRLEVTKLGMALGQEFHLALDLFGGSLKAWGGVDVLVDPGKPTRYRFTSAKVVINDVEASELVEWLGSGEGDPSWFEQAALRARGRLQLEGSLEGTWPERLRLELATHAVELSGAIADSLAVREGQVGFHLDAEVEGDLERVTFALSTHGSGFLAGPESGSSESGSLDVRGEVRRAEGGSATVVLEPSTVEVENLGRVDFSGSVGSLFSGQPPALDLSLELPALDLGAALGHISGPLRAAGIDATRLGQSSGDLALELKVGGSATRPRIDGSFTVLRAGYGPTGPPRVTVDVRGSLEGLELDSAGADWSLERLHVETGEVSAKSLSEALGPRAATLNPAGTVRLALDLGRPCERGSPGDITARGTIAWTGGALSPPGSFGLTGIEAELSWRTLVKTRERSLDLQLDLAAWPHEVLAGPFYADLKGEPVTMGARGKIAWDEGGRIASGTIESLLAKASITGPVSVTGSIERPEGRDSFQLHAALEAASIPGDEAFRVFVREPFARAAPLLEKGELRGRAQLRLELEGPLHAPRLGGKLSLSPSALSLDGLRVEGLEIEIPFGRSRPDEPDREGFVRAGGLQLGMETAGALDLRFRASGDRYQFLPCRWRLFGGELEVQQATLDLAGPRGLSFRGDFQAHDLDTLRITRNHGLPQFEGKLGFELKPLNLEGSRLDSLGTVVLEAFGGTIEASDLTVENLTEPYSSLRLRHGRIRNLHLGRLGETFHFGIMSGVLEGTVKDITLTGGELTSFEVDVQTVRVPGVPQFLNRRAVDSIRRVLSGPAGAIEETFFSKFYFADFGFWCYLRDGIFRFRGKYRQGDTEYILRGRWYQFPRISIINGRPQHPYDWKAIVTNLQKIYAGKGSQK